MARTSTSVIATRFPSAFLALLLLALTAACYLPDSPDNVRSPGVSISPRFSAFEAGEFENIEVELWALPRALLESVVDETDFAEVPLFLPSTYSDLLSSNRAAHATRAWNGSASREFELSLEPGAYHFQVTVSAELDGNEERFLGATWFDWNDLASYSAKAYTPAMQLQRGTISVVDLDVRNIQSFVSVGTERFITLDIFVDDDNEMPLEGAAVTILAGDVTVASGQSDPNGFYQVVDLGIPEAAESLEILVEAADRFPQSVQLPLNETDTTYSASITLPSTFVTVSGNVIDAFTLEGLAGAQVVFTSLPGGLLAPVGSTTNIDGDYSANLNLPVGESEIEMTVSLVGYETVIITIDYGDLIGVQQYFRDVSLVAPQ